MLDDRGFKATEIGRIVDLGTKGEWNLQRVRRWLYPRRGRAERAPERDALTVAALFGRRPPVTRDVDAWLKAAHERMVEHRRRSLANESDAQKQLRTELEQRGRRLHMRAARARHRFALGDDPIETVLAQILDEHGRRLVRATSGVR